MLRKLLFVTLLFCGVTQTYSQICDGPLTVTVEGSSTGDPINIEGETDDPDCNTLSGTLDGSITLTVTGGTPDYEYIWTPNLETTKDLTGLGAGVYSVQVTDQKGCKATKSFVITEPSPVMVEGIPENLECHADSGDPTGSIDITASGGQGSVEGDYIYSWSTDDGAGLVAGQADQANLTVGTYAVTVTDVNGCTDTGEWTITGPTPVAVEGIVDQPDCNTLSGDLDGSINITASGGQGSLPSDYQYLWSGPNVVADAEDQSNLGAGTYTVQVTDVNGCTATAEFILTEPLPVAITGIVDQPDCNTLSGDLDGSINVTASGGQGSSPTDYVYAWTGPGVDVNAEDQSNLGAGTYTVQVTDINGCSATAEFILTEPLPVAVTGDVDNLSCHAANGTADGAIDISPSGGQGSSEADYTYVWTSSDGFGLVDGQADQSNLTVGTYNVVVSDINGCTASAEFTLTQPEIIQILAQETDLECHEDSGDPNGAIDISVNGGQGSVESDYQYNWETTNGSGLVNGQADQSNLSAGTYYLTVTDTNNCTQTAEYILEQPEAVAVSGETENLDCNSESGDPSGSIDVTASGGQGLVEGDYIYTWTTTDGSGLEDGVADQTELSAGTYTLVVTDVNGCTASNTWTLSEPTAVTCSLDSPEVGVGGTNILCAGETGTIEVSAEGGTAPYEYSLDGGTTTQSDPSFEVLAGTHTVTVIDANGCLSTCEITLTEPEAMVAGTCVTNDDCQVNEGEIEVAVEGGVGPYTVTWTSPSGGSLNETELTINSSGGSVTFTGAEGGETYIFTVEDSNGCEIGG